MKIFIRKQSINLYYVYLVKPGVGGLVIAELRSLTECQILAGEIKRAFDLMAINCPIVID